MKTPTGEDCLELLHSLRRRQVAQAFAVRLARAALLAGGVLLLLAALEHWGTLRPNWPIACAVALLLACAFAAVVTFVRKPEAQDIAEFLDHRGETRDRWTTFLAFENATGDVPPLRALARQECVLYLQRRDFRSLLPWQIPRELPWLMVPLLALAIVLWDSGQTRARLAAEQKAGAEEVAGTVQALQQLAETAERQSKEQDSEELKRIAEELRRRAGEMEANATNPDEAQKSAMRQLAALEQLVKQMQERPAQTTPEDLKALASAMKEKPLTQAAAEAMEKGDLAKAAEELEALAEQLAKKEDALSETQVKEAIQEAMERLAQQRQVSQALQELANQMAQKAGQQGATNEALQKLAQMLRQMQPKQGNPGPPGKGQQPTEEMLKNLLAALQNMKQGGPQQGNSSPSPESGSGQISIQSFSGQPSPGSAEMLAGSSFPTGMPGSEHDTGTTASATGTEASEGAEKGADLALSGQLGEGESLSQLLPGAADNSQAQRRYRELYEAMAPAAQDAVLQEEIPLGSRFFIKRYFEAIRPPQ